MCKGSVAVQSRSDSEPSPDTYFDDTTTQCREIEEEKAELKRRKAVLKQLDERVAKIDCDIGSGSIEIEDGRVWVRVSGPNMGDEIKELVHDYCWERESKISYDMASECVIWSLKSEIDTMVKHQTGNIAE